MLNKRWAFALALALAAAPVSSLLAAQGVQVQGVQRCRRCRWRGCRRGSGTLQRRECDDRNGCCSCQYTGGEDGPRRGEAFFAQCGRPRGNKQQVSRSWPGARRTQSSRAKCRRLRRR